MEKATRKGVELRKERNLKGIRKYIWKLVGPKKGEPKTKKIDNKTCHWCYKEHGFEKKPMWSLHTPEDHKGHTPKTRPTTDDDVNLELNDELSSLLSVMRYF